MVTSDDRLGHGQASSRRQSTGHLVLTPGGVLRSRVSHLLLRNKLFHDFHASPRVTALRETERWWERVRDVEQVEARVSGNLVVEVSHHFCCILLTGGKSQGPVTFKGLLYQDVKTRKFGITEGPLTGCLPHEWKEIYQANKNAKPKTNTKPPLCSYVIEEVAVMAVPGYNCSHFTDASSEN